MALSWKVKKLGEISEFKRGLTYSKKDEKDFSNNVVLRANNIDLGKNSLDFTELKYLRDDFIVNTGKKVHKGAIMICTASGSKSHLGKVALIDKEYDYAFGGFMGRILPRPEVISKYLFYTLTSDSYRKFISKLSNGVNINNLKLDDLKNFEIRLPPLSEQHRIVKILDETFERIPKAKENVEKNLKNVQELSNNMQAGLLVELNKKYKNVTLQSVTTRLGDGLHGTPKYDVEGGYFFIAQRNTPCVSAGM